MLANYRRRMFRRRGSRAQRSTQKPNGARATLRGIRKGAGSITSSRYSRFDALFVTGVASAAQSPYRSRTSGAVATTSAAAVCGPGYARTSRNVPYRVRDAVYMAYGLARGHRTKEGGYVGVRRSYVIAHLVPLELGGANDVRNLWPQPRTEAREKDRVEDELHKAVCHGRMRLVEAQQQIVRDC